MQPTLWLALLVGTALDANLPVPIAKNKPGETVMKQLTGESCRVVATTPAVVTSIQAGLPHVRKIAGHRIVAAVEAEGWFVYATSAARDADTGQPVFFISGYAIKKGGREVIWYSVW